MKLFAKLSLVLLMILGSTAQAASSRSIDADSITSADKTKTYTLPTESELLTKNPVRNFWFQDDFIGSAIGTGHAWTAATSGAGAAVTIRNGNLTAESGHPGIIDMSTGTATTGRAAHHPGFDNLKFGSGPYTFEASINLDVLSDGIDTYIYRVGFADTPTGTPADGCYFEYDSTTTTFWRIVCSKASSHTRTTTATTVAAATWIRLKVVVNTAVDSASFYINGTEVSGSPISTNVPVNSVGFYFGTYKSAGTTARVASHDWIYVHAEFSSDR